MFFRSAENLLTHSRFVSLFISSRKSSTLLRSRLSEASGPLKSHYTSSRKASLSDANEKFSRKFLTRGVVEKLDLILINFEA